ncbi:putative membrane protein SirB2 [Natronospira proteinivora]|uniref:Membrane protein SirB2 n=1 Tax=Natronospira proteinivora TaxID=1807133 RepID=A0ABT1G9U1_9GAMM|nr:SirB2 family protein [Natronospira proteinivora]MCP1727058.1 putative membrane protein SirB2 [Natronospira proteinivora]
MEAGLKHLHMSLALLSILGFLARGGWLLVTGEKPQHKLARILPHVVDTFLLLSGIALLAATSWVFLTQPWMLSKFALLVCYIGFGVVAFRSQRPAMRWGFFWLAVLTFLQLMVTAFSKSPAGLLLTFL